MRQTLSLASKAARSEASVFLFGESRTGKALVARSIHAQSVRADHPFVPVDCASLPENLMEAELFGYEKGAFTGASKAKLGLIEAANHGTLFLDEIGEWLSSPNCYAYSRNGNIVALADCGSSISTSV